MHVERVTSTELAILEALTTYRFLTPGQLLRLDFTRSRRHLYAAIQKLWRREKPLIGALDFGVLPQHGRLSRIHFLLPRGALYLAEAHRTEPVSCPSRVRLFRNDYFHRINCVDIQIAVRHWAAVHEATVDRFDVYYDHASGGDRDFPHAKTRVALPAGALIPDAIFTLTTHDGMKRLFAVEMYNGRETLRVERQLGIYLIALERAAIETTYRYEHEVRVLCVFDNEAGMQLVMERLAYKPPERAFFFKTLPDLQADFLSGWHKLDVADPASLFPHSAAVRAVPGSVSAGPHAASHSPRPRTR